MGKHTKGKRLNRLPPFTPIFNEEMDSTAYLELSGTAVKVFTWFKRIDGRLRGKDRLGYNGIFDFTYNEAKRYGFAKRTFSRAIDELGEKGFIEVVSVGGLRGAGRSNSKYKLSSKWQIYRLELKVKGAWRSNPSELRPQEAWN
ncbi:hypothetical protein Gbem_2988 [Citrifermentans bemidjiense Bem]|uniref:Helix-turn-helix domain-containing protein n=1 Tax=Citrifermentans bemidjiense (strain ATCC BAA-1014 / DSM 16622 / JCM 12645 / Bem) TaxID=404380 RepID=B5E822_CITBB|nr:hypothetical protein [Citrifermentans bemidjiense]ACH39991.1 hypothetical protein Gbem_2988 [Citrifermentans bemidjiense Bem]